MVGRTDAPDHDRGTGWQGGRRTTPLETDLETVFGLPR
jgi:hypothetical protein